MTTLLLLHTLCTIAMTGLVWFVQLVHYPLFAWLTPPDVAYAAEHQRRTTWLVGPLMVGEAASACGLLVFLRGTPAAWIAALGFALLVVVWLATAAWQVPGHHRLAHQGHARTVQHLVRTNWVRTIGWTARTVVALALLQAAR